MNYIACQAPLYMEFSRQEYLESIPVPFSKGIFLTQGSNTGLLHCRQIFSREPPKDHRFYQFLKEISPEYSLEGLMLKLKRQYFGHLM